MHNLISNLTDRDGEITKNWYILCLSKDLAKHPIRRRLYDTNYVLFRNKKGEAKCLLDRCLHRGTPLSYGQCLNGNLRCSYHGWEYDEEGKITKVPSESDGTSPPRKPLKKLKTIEKDDVIWVYHHHSDEGNEDNIWDFPLKKDPSWTSYFMVTDFENEVTNLVENFVDVPHTVWVHKGWFRNRTYQEVPAKVSTSQGKVLVEYDQPNDNIGVLIRKLLNPKNEAMVHTDEFIYPNITNVFYSFGERFQYIINSQCTPISTYKTRVYTHISYKIPVIGKLVKPFLNFYTKQVINQDVKIMKQQAENLRTEERPHFQSTIADEPHIQIEVLRRLGIKDQKNVYLAQKEKLIKFII